MINIKFFVFAAIAVISTTSCVFAEAIDLEGNPIAIQGYDAVSYHALGGPAKGYASHSYKWRGFVWYFATEKNMELFKKSPEEYAPQYYGYCSCAVSKGYLSGSNPNVYSIVGNKVYLFVSEDVKINWLRDFTKNLEVADLNWKKIQ